MLEINELKIKLYSRIPSALRTEDIDKCLMEYLKVTGDKKSVLLDGMSNEDIDNLFEVLSIGNRNILTLYHGSTEIVEHPEFGKGKKNCDYGSGFYCTEDRNAGKLWSVWKNSNGFNNKYNLDLNGLKVLRLDREDIIGWLALLIKNRIPNDLDSIAEERRETFVRKNCKVNVEDYNVIIGYRADDSYFKIVKGFLNGIIDYNILKESLSLGNLELQVVLISYESFQKIQYLSNEVCSIENYYNEYVTNDRKARLLYTKLEEESFKKDRKTIVDFL